MINLVEIRSRIQIFKKMEGVKFCKEKIKSVLSMPQGAYKIWVLYLKIRYYTQIKGKVDERKNMNENIQKERRLSPEAL